MRIWRLFPVVLEPTPSDAPFHPAAFAVSHRESALFALSNHSPLRVSSPTDESAAAGAPLALLGCSLGGLAAQTPSSGGPFAATGGGISRDGLTLAEEAIADLTP